MKKKLEDKRIMIIAIILVILAIIAVKFLDAKLDNNDTISILDSSEDKSKSIEDTEEKIIIYITGEVENEGVYELKEGSRISDAIKIAGGTKETANLKNVNLAYELEDGEKIYIPNINEDTEEIVSNGIEATSKEKTININKASSEELQELNGIGAATAQSIIEYREKNGKFQTTDDLLNVPGIGEAKLEKIQEEISTK